MPKYYTEGEAGKRWDKYPREFGEWLIAAFGQKIGGEIWSRIINREDPSDNPLYVDWVASEGAGQPVRYPSISEAEFRRSLGSYMGSLEALGYIKSGEMEEAIAEIEGMVDIRGLSPQTPLYGVLASRRITPEWIAAERREAEVEKGKKGLEWIEAARKAEESRWEVGVREREAEAQRAWWGGQTQAFGLAQVQAERARQADIARQSMWQPSGLPEEPQNWIERFFDENMPGYLEQVRQQWEEEEYLGQRRERLGELETEVLGASEQLTMPGQATTLSSRVQQLSKLRKELLEVETELGRLEVEETEQPRRPVGPPVPSWLTEYAPQLKAGQPLPETGRLGIPSGQLVARTTPTQWAQLAGVSRHWDARTPQDLLFEAQRRWPTKAPSPRGWRTPRQ